MTTREIQDRLRALSNREAASFAARYFKTGPGQYGQGDVFLGLRAQVMHALAKEYKTLALDQVIELLRSAVHEDRLLAQSQSHPQGRGLGVTLTAWPAFLAARTP
ncbi:MAG: DNA alkylation repair protein [Isosphaeraceae bacterium]|jgi:hypothetical protein